MVRLALQFVKSMFIIELWQNVIDSVSYTQLARERNRLVRIEECKKRIAEIEENIALIQRECEILQQRKCRLEEEYKCLPDDTDMREALNSLMEQERCV